MMSIHILFGRYTFPSRGNRSKEIIASPPNFSLFFGVHSLLSRERSLNWREAEGDLNPGERRVGRSEVTEMSDPVHPGLGIAKGGSPRSVLLPTPRSRPRPVLEKGEACVTVSPRAEKRILRGHPWVFRTDVSAAADLEPGAIVRVLSAQGHFLGHAFFSSRSEIQLRMFHRAPELPATFLEERLGEALKRRQALCVGDRRGFGSVYRMVHGEADGLPSLVVDRYGPYLVLQTVSEGMERLKPRVVDLLDELVHPAGILERNDLKCRALEGLPPRVGLLRGSVPPKVEVEEAGIRLEVDLWHGKKTGLYLDQRDNHVRARGYAWGRVLEAFCYTGGFAVHVARFADQVLALDISAELVEQTRNNASRNNLWNVRAHTADAFEFLRQAKIGRAHV
jgi:23S rRNA (cytosine1962-C5)-methyltransferase